MLPLFPFRFSFPRVFTKEACFLPALILQAPLLFSQTRIQARAADEFVDSMGINVHMEYTSTPYGDYGAINRALQLLGMRHFRDEINDTDASFVNELQQIGTVGYSLCGLIEGGNDYPPRGKKLYADAVVPMIRNLKPVIEAIEEPNEPDNPKFLYDGVPYPQGAVDESADLWNIVQNNPEISSLPVVALSEGNAPDFKYLAAITPPPAPYATYGNMHAYQAGGVGDNLLADWYIPYPRLLTGNDVLWTTEMGYHNNTNFLTDGEQQGVSERASAIYLPIAFLSGFNSRVFRTFSYELIDENPQGGDSGEGHYGLLHYDGSPKPAFVALKNLIELLREPGVRGFAPGSLEIIFSSAPPTMRYTLLQKSTGEFYLALWNDVPVYQIATATTPGIDIYPARVLVTLTLTMPEVFTVYAPNDSTGVKPTSAYTASTTARSITLELPPQVLLVKIGNN